jgi:hypothetical protein
MNEPTFDLETAHRFFAAAMNNQAWELLESPARNSEQDQLMRTTAHAAARHWSEVGQAINHQRAECLLAQVHAALGEASGAVRHARRPLDLMTEAGDSIEAFDLVFTHDAASRAFLLAEELPRAASHRAQVESARASITDAADREVVEAWLGRDETA